MNFVPSELIKNGIDAYLIKKTTASQWIYWLVLIAVVAALAALPFIYVDVSVHDAGVIRPIAEKSEIRASITEWVDSVYVREGQNLKQGDTILTFLPSNPDFQIEYRQKRLEDLQAHINDLSFLSRGLRPDTFRSMTRKQEYFLFVQRRKEQETNLSKTETDLNRHWTLFSKGIISAEEYESYEYEYNKNQNALALLKNNQITRNIGYIRIGMPVNIQIASFNYNEWGSIAGKVTDISSDFLTDNTGNKAFYKVKCSLDRNYLIAIKIKQHDITDCGAACLASVAAYYGLKFPVSRIRQFAFTDKKGTNVLGMIEAAQKLGLEAKGVKGPFECLKEIPKPAIAHVVVKEQLQHFVVIYKVTKKHIVVMDPGDGRLHKKTHEAFQKEWTGVLILLLPCKTFEKGNRKKSALKSFMDLIRPHKSLMTQALFGAVIYSILGLSTAVYVGKITDYVLVDQNLNLLNLMGIIMILIILLKTFIGAMKSILALKTGQKIDASLILGYYKHLLSLPQQFFDTMRVGEIISRINDAVKIRVFINNVSLDLVVNFLILLFTFCLMLFYSWKLAVIALLSAPLFLLIYFLFNRLNKKYQRKIMESGADLEAHLVESLNSVSTIKRFGLEDFANLKTEVRFVNVLKNTYQSIYGSIVANNGIEFVSAVITVAVLWAGSYFVIHQELTPGTLMLFYTLTGYVLTPIGRLISSNQTIQDALIAADRLFQILDLEREEDDQQKIRLEKDMLGDIQFNNVSFRYGSRKQVFEALDLTIRKGKTTAIVGESGSGKTTLVSLLQHLYPIQSGSIHIGNYNIAQIGNESLRQMIGSVPQQIELFVGTVIENIALGDFEPDMKRIIELCEQLGIREFIEKLPNSYLTFVGEHGASLSGGERQRIAIARALYQNPEILIFDEATSSLDSISEKYVQQTLTDLARQGKTVIIIAHRLSTIKNADTIVVLEEGKVAQAGNHAQLIEQEGVYRRLWNEQYEYI